MYLDEAFESHMRTMMGAKAYDSLPLNSRKRLLSQDWEYGMKRLFTGGDKEWTVDLPGPERRFHRRAVVKTETLKP